MKIKSLFITGLGAISVTTALPFLGAMPVLAGLGEAGTVIAQNLQHQPQVQLRLRAEKKVVQKTQQGKQQVTWQTLRGNVGVRPGDVIRYTIIGKNNSNYPIKTLVVTQPLPKQTIYVLNSVNVKNNRADITYSIDNGNSFVEKPTIQIKLPNGKVATPAAPPELYTHLRWKIAESIAPATAVNATYQVRVR